MSRSYRSQKESVIAARRIPRALDGSPALPRIVDRGPAPGDSHPLSKHLLERRLPQVPVEFYYGLSRIELRPRQLPFIGHPFGCYRVREREIILYSLPPVLRFRSLSADLRESLNRFHAIIEEQPKGFVISWPKPALRSIWFYSYVFVHELGHHFVEQYRSKNSRIGSINAEELVADLHARRLTDKLLSSLDPRSVRPAVSKASIAQAG